jgi:hypothetical protein
VEQGQLLYTEAQVALRCSRAPWKVKVARLCFCPLPGEVSPMDEAHTLRFLGWTIGGLVGAVFLLNAIVLSLI